jgi:hypothetical protein
MKRYYLPWLIGLAALLAALACCGCGGGNSAGDDDAGADDDASDDDATDDDTAPDDDTVDDDTTDDDADDDSFDPSVTVGNTYQLVIPLSDWTEPHGVGDIIGYYVPILLFGVTSATPVTIDIIGAVGATDDDVIQNECVVTTDFTDGVWPDGAGQFSIGPTDYQVKIQNIDAKLWQATSSGRFRADGSGFDNGVLAGMLDARELVNFFVVPLEMICVVAAAFGAPCQPCPSDGETYCVGIKAEGYTGEVVPGLTVQKITPEDIGPNCDDDTVDDDTVDDDTIAE